MLTEVKPVTQTFPGRFGELVKFPLQRIHIELTNVCNFDCTFCPKQEMTRHYEYMDFERVCGIIDEIAEYKMAEKITFHVMGEPFMHPRFFEILEHAAERGVKTGITTNGTYLDEEMGIKLETVTASQVNISLQTPDEESFKTRKSRRMKFDEYHNRILDFIGTCLKQSKPPKIKVHFLNTSIKTEVPGEDWSVGTMSVINNTKDLRKTFRYWAKEVHKICPPMNDEEKLKVEKKIDKLSFFKLAKGDLYFLCVKFFNCTAAKDCSLHQVELLFLVLHGSQSRSKDFAAKYKMLFLSYSALAVFETFDQSLSIILPLVTP